MREHENIMNFVDKDEWGVSSGKQVSRVCAAQHLPSMSHHGASVIGIRNIAKSQTQRWQDIQSIRLRDQKTKQKQNKTNKKPPEL